jgi:S1-C subfamily serine protease
MLLGRILWCVLLFSGSSFYSLSQQVVADIVKQSSDAVVLIVISDSAGKETTLGSGFLVSADGEIVTNHHVIKDAHSAIVKWLSCPFPPAHIWAQIKTTRQI